MDLLFDLITLPFEILTGGSECFCGCFALLVAGVICVGAVFLILFTGVF